MTTSERLDVTSNAVRIPEKFETEQRWDLIFFVVVFKFILGVGGKNTETRRMKAGRTVWSWRGKNKWVESQVLPADWTNKKREKEEPKMAPGLSWAPGWMLVPLTKINRDERKQSSLE